MASDLKGLSYEEKAAAIAGDIVVAIAETLEKPRVDLPEGARAYGDGLARIYLIVHATVLKSLKS